MMEIFGQVNDLGGSIAIRVMAERKIIAIQKPDWDRLFDWAFIEAFKMCMVMKQHMKDGNDFANPLPELPAQSVRKVDIDIDRVLKLELSDDEWKKINAQLALQGKLNREIAARPAQKQIKDQSDELDRMLKRTQMILRGDGRAVFIQDELDKAEKIAKDAKFELTELQRRNITDKAGKLYDLQAKMDPTHIQPYRNQVFSDSLLRMGGQIGNIRAQTATTNYDKITAEKTAAMQLKMDAIYDKLPTRSELSNGGAF